MTDKKIIGINLDEDTAKALADALDTIGTIAVIDVSEKQGIPPEELMERASAKGGEELRKAIADRAFTHMAMLTRQLRQELEHDSPAAKAKGNAEDEEEEYVPAKHNGHDPMYG